MLIRKYGGARLRQIETDGEGNQGGGGKTPEPETFSKDYVRELRAENNGWRLKATEMEGIAKSAKESAEKASEDAQKIIAERASEADLRIIRAELKALAIKAGIVDVDGLKLADFDGLKLDDKGEVVGADALIDALKKAKPYLFAAPSSSSVAMVPAKEQVVVKKATDMTKDEYAEARKKIIGIR